MVPDTKGGISATGLLGRQPSQSRTPVIVAVVKGMTSDMFTSGGTPPEPVVKDATLLPEASAMAKAPASDLS